MNYRTGSFQKTQRLEAASARSNQGILGSFWWKGHGKWDHGKRFFRQILKRKLFRLSPGHKSLFTITPLWFCKCLFFYDELCVGVRYLIFCNRGSSWHFGQKNYMFWRLQYRPFNSHNPYLAMHVAPLNHFDNWKHSTMPMPLRRMVLLLVILGSGGDSTWGKPLFSSEVSMSSPFESSDVLEFILFQFKWRSQILTSL